MFLLQRIHPPDPTESTGESGALVNRSETINRRPRSIAVALVLAVATGAGCAPARVAQPTPAVPERLTARLQAKLDSLHAAGHFPGATVSMTLGFIGRSGWSNTHMGNPYEWSAQWFAEISHSRRASVRAE